MEAEGYPDSGGLFKYSGSRELLIAIFFIAILIISFLLTYYRIKAARAEKINELEALSKLKTSELIQWRSERMSEAAFFGSHKLVRSLAEPTGKSPDQILNKELTVLFTPFLNEWRYEEIIAFSSDAEIIYSIPENRTIEDTALISMVKETMERQQILVQGFNFYSGPDVYFDIFIPFLNTDSTGHGLLLLRTNPERYIFPLVEAWPSSGKSSEVVLSIKEADSVTLLSRSAIPGQNMELSIPLSRTDIASVKAATGFTGAFNGKDYSGRKVIAYLSHIPDSEWFLVVKEDQADVYSGLIVESLLTFLIIILIFLLYLLLYKLYVSKRELKVHLALYETEAKFKALYDHSMDAMLLTSPDGSIQSANPAACTLFGMSEEELTRGGRQRIVDINDSRLLLLLEERSKTGKSKGELSFIRSDGTLFQAEVTSSLFSDKNNELRTSMIIRDITQRILYEESLRLSREQLHSMVESVPVAMAMFDTRMNYLVTSKRWLDEYGGGRNDLTGLCHYDFLPDLPARWREFHKRGLAGELIEVDEDLWIKDDGTEYWLRWSIAPWFETTGTIGGIIIATENITPQKKAENNLRLLNIELEERVAERTQQLTAVNKELEAFSYSISHDLRAPLRGIDGFTRILTEEYSDHLDDEGKRLCSVIRENTLKMSKLIEDLLAFSKLGKKELNISVIRMDNMVNSIFHEITTPGERERITMKIQNLHDSQGDTNMMRQVWANLLSNAVKFTSKKPDPVIEISSETETNRTIYHVKDNGAGFDMKYASKLFGVFQRLHLLSDFEGTGVGLATVQRIINKHGGQIWAVGKVNEGATFSFSLPSVINE